MRVTESRRLLRFPSHIGCCKKFIESAAAVKLYSYDGKFYLLRPKIHKCYRNKGICRQWTFIYYGQRISYIETRQCGM
jgi:hypothetical protein